MTSSTITIHHFQGRYTVPGSTLNPGAVQRRLDRIAQERLTQTWENWLAPVHDPDEALYFVKDMAVNLTLDLSRLDDDGIAQVWMRSLHEGLRRTLGQRGSGVVVFRNRAEFIARFIDDLLRGNPWDCWYYQEFAPLKSLPLSQIVVQVLTADGDIGRDALLELAGWDSLTLLLASLSDTDVATIVAPCLLPPSPRVVLPNTYAVWVQSLRELLATKGINGAENRDRTGIRLYLTLLRQRPELGPDVNLARFIWDLLTLVESIQGLTNRQRFLRHIETEDWRELLPQLSSPQRWLTNLVREASGPAVAALLRELGGEVVQPITRRLFTPFGGLFLLLPSLIDLELYDFLQHSPYPDPQGCSKGSLLLWVMALQCLGPGHTSQALTDPALVLLGGLSHPLDRPRLNAYEDILTPTMHTEFHQAFQAHQNDIISQPYFSILQQQATSDPAHLTTLQLCSADAPILTNPEWDRALAPVSELLLRWFTTKLGAFAGSSPEYIRRNFLESQVEIEVSEEEIMVEFLTCPLQMVLRMAGFEGRQWEVTWLGRRGLGFRF